MNDLLVFSEDVPSHFKKLEDILKALTEANLKIKTSKCLFLTKKVNYLGYSISQQGMSIDQASIDSIKNMPYPKNKRQVQAFLGTTNYFRSFVKNYSDLAEPLYSLLRKDKKFQWTSTESKSVDLLKDKLSTSPILKLPDFNKTFHLYTDASLVGVSACLMQTDENDVLHPISYVAKSLTEPQRNYSATKREMLALIFGLEKFRHLILAYPITVYTDHKPLLGIMTKTTKDSCITRWALLAQEYKINLKYLPGKSNIFADSLSRLVDVNSNIKDFPEELDEKLLHRINAVSEEHKVADNFESYIPVKVPWTENELMTAQEKDDTCTEIKKALKDNLTDSEPTLINFRVIKGILYVHRSNKRAHSHESFLVPYIPDTLMKKAFQLVHDDMTAGHKGYERTIEQFRRNFYNATESKLIKELCDTCQACKLAKAIPKPVPIGEYPIPKKPFTTVNADILGPLPMTETGNRFILVCRDFTTRYTVVEALERKDTDCILIALRRVISHYGPSQTLLTDNAQEFKSEKMRKFCEFYNMKKREIAPYHPQSAGLAERINRELNKLLRIYTHEIASNDWDEFLPTLQLTINNTYNSSLGETPFYALYGYDSPTVTLTNPRLNYSEDDLTSHLKRVIAIRDYTLSMLKANQKQVTYQQNEKRKEKPIQVGDRVFAKLKGIHTNKLDLPVSGPFKVIGQKGRAYKLSRPQSRDELIVHPDDLIISACPNLNETAEGMNEAEDEKSLDSIKKETEDCSTNGNKNDESKPIESESRYNLRPRK